MNLAQITSELSQRDSEKTAIKEEIRKLEDMKFQGFKGLLRLSVIQVDRVKGDLSIDYDITPEDSFLPTTESLRNKNVGEVLDFIIQTKNIHINLTCNAAYVPEFVQIDDSVPNPTEELPDAIQSVYSARMSGADIPEDTELRTELPLHLVSTTRQQDGDESPNPESKPIIHVKASFDELDNTLKSKNLQLQQLQDEIDALAQVIREVRNPPKAAKSSGGKGGAGKGKKGGKGKKAAAAQREEQEDGEGETGAAGAAATGSDSMFGTATKLVGKSVEFAVNQRAVLLFVAGSALVYAFGDYASV